MFLAELNGYLDDANAEMFELALPLLSTQDQNNCLVLQTFRWLLILKKQQHQVLTCYAMVDLIKAAPWPLALIDTMVQALEAQFSPDAYISCVELEALECRIINSALLQLAYEHFNQEQAS